MQRPSSWLDLFPEPIDLNQGSVPNNTNTNNTPSSWENDINPNEIQLPNYNHAINDASMSPVMTTNDSALSVTAWDRGESSSSGLNLQSDEPCNENAKSGLRWPSPSCNPSSGSSSRSENWFFEPFNTTGGSQGSQTHSSNRGLLSIGQNHGHVRENDNSQRAFLGAVLPHNIKSDHHDTQQIPNFCPSSSSNLVNSINLLERNDASGSAFGTWGSSCKRKAVEGTSASSSSNQLAGKNVMQHHGTSCYNSPGNLVISSAPLIPSPINHSEPPNSSTRVGIIPPPPPDFSTRSNLAQHEQVSYNPPVSSSLRRFGVNTVPHQLSRPISRTTNSSDLRSTTTLRMDPNSTLSQAHPSIHVNDSRRTRSSSSPWNGSMSSQGGSSSSSYAFEEANNNSTRSSQRHNFHHPAIVSVSETRNSVLPDQIDWSFVPETSSSTSSRNYSYGSGSRNGSGSNVRTSPSAWLPHHHHHHQTPQNRHQRFSETAPWIQNPPVESESGNNNSSRRSHFGLIPSANEAGSSSRGQRQSDQRSAALLMDVPGDDVNGWHALAAVEERHRLIRQVLSAMQRGVRLQAEDYMIFDPFMDEFAELHDRHRDMRLDVDNMSYEELLALEERIGDVNTGLSEEKISSIMKQRKHNSMEASQSLEPCCICQEDYDAGDIIGILDCMHEFHTNCIKQWLTQKNLCPICKMTALET